MNLTFDTPTRKVWESADGYRIVWRSEAFGIRQRPAFYATVRCRVPGYERWDFAAHRRPYRTFEAALRACKFNRWLWAKFVKLSHQKPRGADRDVRLSHARGRRVKLKALDARGRRGRAHVLGSMPVWAEEQAEPSLIKLQFERAGRK